MTDNHTLSDNETAEAQAVSNTYTLSDDEKSQIIAIATEMQELQREAAAVLKSIARVRKLNGDWEFDQSIFTFKKRQ